MEILEQRVPTEVKGPKDLPGKQVKMESREARDTEELLDNLVRMVKLELKEASELQAQRVKLEKQGPWELLAPRVLEVLKGRLELRVYKVLLVQLALKGKLEHGEKLEFLGPMDLEVTRDTLEPMANLEPQGHQVQLEKVDLMVQLEKQVPPVMLVKLVPLGLLEQLV